MKVLVAHPLQQHSYRLASAIKKTGYLEKYITCVYLKKNSLTKFVTNLLPRDLKERGKSRRCETLDDSEIILFCEVEGLLRLLCQNMRFLKKYEIKLHRHMCDRFAKKVAKYAIANSIDVVITYDNCSPILFEILKNRAPNIKRILDVSAASRIYMKNIYLKDVKLAPTFAEQLKRECPQVWNDKQMKQNRREIELAHLFLSPSSFVDESLINSGISSNRIYKAPYGINLSEFRCKDYSNILEKRPLKFIYIGGVKEIKGIYYLLEAFSRYSANEVTLTVVGDFDPTCDYIKKYSKNTKFIGRILHRDVNAVLIEHDVFAFASLGDSFAFSVLEAGASGLPLLITCNTGIKDQMIDGVEGFIIQIQSIEAICKKIDWFLAHRKHIKIMGHKAREMALRMTWDNYDTSIKRCMDDIEKGV